MVINVLFAVGVKRMELRYELTIKNQKTRVVITRLIMGRHYAWNITL